MMKKTLIALAALAVLAWGCSSDANDSNTPPQSSGIPVGTDARPKDTLNPYVSKNDLLCATIGGEVRAVSAPRQVGDGWVAQLTVASNDAGVAVELSYYCEQLHRIFTIAWTRFDASMAPKGTGGIYLPEFIKHNK